MVVALGFYLLGMVIWVLYWLPFTFQGLYLTVEHRKRAARFTIAAPLWPLFTVWLLCKVFVYLIRMAR